MNKERILILSVGGSEEPLIFSINEFKPDKIVFIHSTATLYQCGKIIEKTKWNKESDLGKDLSNLFNEYKNKLFDIFRTLISDFPSPEEYDEFYSDFIDFLDRNFFKDDKKFNYKFLDFLYSLKIENNYYKEFSKIINGKSFDSENFYLQIANESKYFKDILEDYIKISMPSILEDSNSEENVLRAEIKDHESLDNSFSISKKVFNNFSNVDDYEVIVDFTGGTKPMVSGVVLAVVEGNFSNFEFRYVGSKNSERRTKKGLGIVEDGSEITKLQENPFIKFATLEFNRGKQFFNRYQFKAAIDNFSLVEEKTDDENLINLANFYKKIVNFYDSWDKFSNDYEDLEKPPEQRKEGSLTRYYKYTLNYFLEYDEYISKEIKKDSEFYNQILRNIDFLNLKISVKDKNFKNDIEYYLPDLLNNAQRRIDERKFDDAVARLYRAIELIAQLNLKELDIIYEEELRRRTFFIDKVKLFKESKNRKIDVSDVKKWHDYKNSEKQGSCYFKIGSLNSYKLLKMFEVDLAKEYLDDDELFNLVINRNKSILAHGLVPMTKENADDLFDAVLNYARKYNPNIDELMELAKFPKLEVY